MAIKKSSSKKSAPKRSVKKAAPKKAAPKAVKSEAKSNGVKSKSSSIDTKDKVSISDETKPNKKPRAGDAKPTDETKPTNETKPGEETKPTDEVKPGEDKPTEEGKEAGEKDELKSELEDIKGLLEGLAESFAGKEAAASEGSSGSSGGGESGGGESGGGEKAAPVQNSSPMQRPNQNGNTALDRKLSNLAIQVLQSGGGGIPMNGNAAFGAQGGFQGLQGGAQGLRGGVQGLRGARGRNGNNARGQLANLYFGAGGPNNQSIRPETHQLVQAALGGGGGFGAAMGAGGGLNGLGGIPGLNGGFGSPLGAGAPQFGARPPAFGGFGGF